MTQIGLPQWLQYVLVVGTEFEHEYHMEHAMTGSDWVQAILHSPSKCIPKCDWTTLRTRDWRMLFKSENESDTGISYEDFWKYSNFPQSDNALIALTRCPPLWSTLPYDSLTLYNIMFLCTVNESVHLNSIDWSKVKLSVIKEFVSQDPAVLKQIRNISMVLARIVMIRPTMWNYIPDLWLFDRTTAMLLLCSNPAIDHPILWELINDVNDIQMVRRHRTRLLEKLGNLENMMNEDPSDDTSTSEPVIETPPPPAQDIWLSIKYQFTNQALLVFPSAAVLLLKSTIPALANCELEEIVTEDGRQLNIKIPSDTANVTLLINLIVTALRNIDPNTKYEVHGS